MIITISADRINYGKEIEEVLRKNNIRVKGDYRNRPFGKKLYEAQVKKIPYILIIGEEEEKSRNVAIRQNLQDKGKKSIESFLEEIRPLILPKVS
jgi:threonyl-tRNA synthetase